MRAFVVVFRYFLGHGIAVGLFAMGRSMTSGLFDVTARA
jgi:hypothetical protein